MERVNEMMLRMYASVICALTDFKESERGDTNFISMLLIIGIVVVLAGLFLILGKGVMSSITSKVTDFINSL